MHVIHTHPRLVFRREVCDNPYYLPPEIFEGASAARMDDSVQQLLEGMVENTRLRHRLNAEKEALRRSEKLALAGQMAATIAHEINNPLEAITNLWYLLGRENLSPEGRDFLVTMGSELNRVSHIARQTLEFYRSGISAQAVDLPGSIEEAVEAVFRRSEARGTTTIDVRHRAPATIFGFAGELRQLFVNLLVNAQEARASRIQIRTTPSRDWSRPSRRGVRILVADDGPGIPAAVVAKIFEPFFTTKQEKGTGLGLWVSQGIVQKHEGSIAVRTSTRPGQSGTMLSIFLPTA